MTQNSVKMFRNTLSKLVGDTFPTLKRRWRRRLRLTPAGWERFYAETQDPFGIDGNPYEQGKFEHMMEALDGRRYGHALEVCCSIGSFTEMLAPACDDLLAIDISQVAVDRTRARLADKPWVKVERRTVPEELPKGPFDLVVCADVLYYLSPNELPAAVRRLARSVSSGGTFLALHYLGDGGGLMGGNEVHTLLPQLLDGFRLVRSERRTGIGPHGSGYQLDRYDRPLDPIEGHSSGD